MKSGVYALASLDGGPVREADLSVLSLPPPSERTPFALRLVDSPAAETHSGSIVRGQVMLALLGHIDDPVDLASRLSAPTGSAGATLAFMAFERWGADLPAEMPGEWTLVRWDGDRRDLVA